jgi:hypothetical protein
MLQQKQNILPVSLHTLCLFIIAGLIGIFFAYQCVAQQEELDLNGFQRPDGAITLSFGGDTVDPYFATVALLTARESGLDISKEAKSWINWGIKRQRPDGLFERYRINNNGAWEPYAAADADDAMLALWIELLYSSDDSEKDISGTWKASIKKAEEQLAKLFDAEQGIYHVSQDNPAGLLMDNTEIYSAFLHIAQEKELAGAEETAKIYQEKADKLRDRIVKVFGIQGTEKFRISTQPGSGDSFYPYKAAQLFPVLYQVLEEKQAVDSYDNWIGSNRREWISQRDMDYPWGLFAVLALQMHDIESASCWENRAEPMRYSGHWNVLEEVALQHVKSVISQNDNNKIACVGISLL